MYLHKPVTAYQWDESELLDSERPFTRIKQLIKHLLVTNKLMHLVMDVGPSVQAGPKDITILVPNLPAKGLVDAYLDAYREHPERISGGLDLNRIQVKAYNVQIYPLLLESAMV